MRDAGGAIEAADRPAVVGELREVLLVVRVLDARRRPQLLGDGELILRVRLERGRPELLVEIRQLGIHPRPRIGRYLVSIGIGVLRPEPGPEDAAPGEVRHRQQVAELAIAIELVGRAGRRDRRAVVVLLVVVAVRVDLVVDGPAAAEKRVDADVLEVGRDSIEIVPVVICLCRVAAQQVVVAELGDLGTRRTLGVRRVGVEEDVRAKRRDRRLVREDDAVLA